MELCNEKLKPEMFKTADDIQGFIDTLIHIADTYSNIFDTSTGNRMDYFKF